MLNALNEIELRKSDTFHVFVIQAFQQKTSQLKRVAFETI